MDRPVFVGRGVELDALAAHLGGSGVLLVSGPAGIGKTTLVEEALARAAGVRVVRGWCPPEAPPPLWPWRAALRHAGASETPDAGPGEPASAASARFVALAALTDALVAAGPLAVVLEDLHWADTASLDLLAQVAAASAGTGVAVIATVRSPAPENVAMRLAALGRYGATTLSVARFTPAEVAELVGADAAPEVHRTTGGLPLLVATAQDGPADLATVVRGLLAPLGPEHRAIVEAAAVLGNDVDERLLTAMTGTVVEAAVTAAWHGGVLTVDDGRYRFMHDLVRSGVLGRLDPSTARRLHRDAALALENDGDPEHAGRIAGHWRAAGPDRDTRRAASQWSRRAADQARAARAFDDAVRHLADARDDLPFDADPAERIEATLALAGAEFLAGRFDRCLEHMDDAADQAAGLGRYDLVAQAALVLQGVAFREAADRVARRCRQALTGGGLDDVTRARLLAQIAAMAVDQERVEEAVGPAREAITLAESSGHTQAVIEAARARELTLVQPGDSVERMRLGDMVADRAEAAGLPLAAVAAQAWRMQSGYLLARLDVVDTAALAMDRIAARSALPVVRWYAHRARAARALLTGAFAESTEQSQLATAIARRTGDTTAIALFYAHGIDQALLRGDPGALPDGYLDALRGAPQMGLVIASRAGALLLTGADPREDYERLVAMLPLRADHPAWAGTLVALPDLIAAYHDADAAELVERQLAPFRPYPGAYGSPTVYFRGSISRQLGELAAVRGDLVRAEELLREAIARNRTLNAQPDLALATLGLARVLHRDARLDEAARTVQHALTLAGRLDMPGTVTTAGRLAASIAADRNQTDPLTAREREVATLVAEALSNKQIAARLVLSERTVESHVRSILAKTQCANRTEFVTRWSPS